MNLGEIMNFRKVKKAIFPVAGLGTRFLPATKSTPKEMLPIVDKPLVQYAVEEAMSAGITQMIFVTSSNKHSIEDHFDSNHLLEQQLKKNQKHELLETVRKILPKHISCVYLRQAEPLGLGHAILCAKPVVEDEPFAILLADDLIHNGDHSFSLKGMISLYENQGASSVLVEKINPRQSNQYGVIDIGTETLEDSIKLQGVVEKPPAHKAPSHFGIIGRYVFSSRIFSYLENTTPGVNKEIQLTDGISRMLAEEPVHALRLKGQRFDCGNKLGYLEATLHYAAQHPEIGPKFVDMMRKKAAKLAENPTASPRGPRAASQR